MKQPFTDLLRGISIGKLKTYQLYDRMKVRFHLPSSTPKTCRKAEPRFWARLGEKDEDFATDLAQAILVSHLEMIKAVLDDLGIPNQDGFFDKDIDGTKYLTDGWQQRTYEKFKDAYPASGAVVLHQSSGVGTRQIEQVQCSRVPAMSKEFFDAIRAGDRAKVRTLCWLLTRLLAAKDDKGLGAFIAAKYSRAQ